MDVFAVDILLEASYFDRCIRVIPPMERRAVQMQSRPVPTISVIRDNEQAEADNGFSGTGKEGYKE